MILFIIILFAIPLIAIGILVVVKRSPSTAHLVKPLVWTGAAGAALTSLYAFSIATVPIAPYELGPGAWTPILWQSLLALCVGFGLGVLLAAALALPYTYIKSRRARNKT